MAASRPLPGIRFEAPPRAAGDALPRMDIPIFAGFAASGPLHVPVPVEDVGELEMIFGGDVELPRPLPAAGARPEPRFAHLVPAVRAFFLNGGSRCWVVRVAGSAAWNRFAVPGLTKVNADGSLEPAYAWARSEGSWSDPLRVRTNLVPKPLRVVSFDLAQAAPSVAVGSTREVAAGDLVRVSWPSSDVSLYLFVTSLESVTASPPSGSTAIVTLTGTPIWIQTVVPSPPDTATQYVKVTAPLSVPSGTTAVERLTFDLTVRSETDAPLRLAGLGFAPEHPRYFAALPADAALFEDAAQSAGGGTMPFRPKQRAEFAPNFLNAAQAPNDGWPDLWRETAAPRFPLAVFGATNADATSAFDGAVFIPAGMSALFSAEQGPEAIAGTALERDGLTTFSADLFLDPSLRDATARDLLDRADALRYQANLSLTGIHAALGIEEATMLAVPDAVHRGWFRDSGGTLASPPASSPLAHPELWRWMDCREPLPANPPEPNGGFIDCHAIEPVPAPLLSASLPAGGTYTLTWSTEAGATEELQEATRPDFGDAATLLLGSGGTLTIYGRAAGDFFYRVRRLRGSRTSDWSNGVAVRVAAALGFAAVSDDDGGDDPELRAIHVAMVRMCAARADLVALLSLPRHYDERQAVAYASTLGTLLEPQTHSYGAIWHPWLITIDENGGALRTSPPDGATAGVMAARAASRGAWVAPANEPLRGVVSLTPAIPAAARQALQDAAVNLIRREPSGFLCLDADTLSTDDDVRPLNVRRLLILVRRAALRAGNDYAFEPNGDALRNTVKRGFESLLATLFARGAFAGRNARGAYQVITDETVNTPQAADAGRFIAELRIAPSRPLSFLTIRLLQRAEASAAVEVR
jgi:hypothetical protein